MSTLVDEVLIVTKDANTPKSTLESTKEALQKVGAPIAGVVLNGVNKKNASYYYYYSEHESSNNTQKNASAIPLRHNTPTAARVRKKQ